MSGTVAGSKALLSGLARWTTRTTIGALAVFGAAGIAFHGLLGFERSSFPSTMPDDAGVVGSLPSPDHEYKAVVFNQNGGGAISPYCFDYISIVPAGTADKDAWAEQFSVFAASCGSLAFAMWGEDLKWKSSDELQIRFDPTTGARGISAMTIKGYAAGGKIRLSYAQKN